MDVAKQLIEVSCPKKLWECNSKWILYLFIHIGNVSLSVCHRDQPFLSIFAHNTCVIFKCPRGAQMQGFLKWK